jgi:hypothetical protein|tara:strand:+ start:454 stop:654 length:201 start_codon:yes stop_codon:yes gene_type:complete
MMLQQQQQMLFGGGARWAGGMQIQQVQQVQPQPIPAQVAPVAAFTEEEMRMEIFAWSVSKGDQAYF